MKKIVAIMSIAAILFIPLYGKVISLLSAKPAEEKLGYIPDKEILNLAALEHKPILSEWLFLKAVVYYGGRIDTTKLTKRGPIEYLNMYRFLDTATYVDPYNIDAYYFAQAIFTWDVGMVKEVNQLLERGLLYRTWDFYLPFFLGFNNFYFLKDYKKAASYAEQAARITGNPLFTNLASRFLYESNETEVAVSFLRFMIERTWNQKVRQHLEMRMKALEAVNSIEQSIKRFEERYNAKPQNLKDLLSTAIIQAIPLDPYGGEFYMDKKGKVRTTSQFVLRVPDEHSDKDRKPE